MSYCRWSSDCFNSDVYVYESDNGFVIHVASYRCTSDIPRPVVPKEMGKWVNYMRETVEWAISATRVPIGLPLDGLTLGFETAKETVDKLVEMREMGYIVPQYAIDNLLLDAKENDTK